MLKKIGILAIGISMLVACGDKKNAPNDNNSSSEQTQTVETPTASTDTTPSPSEEAESDYVSPADVFNKKSQKYQIKEVVGEEFDRCAPYELQTKDGKKVQMPKAIVKSYMCFDESLLPYNDQYIVYQTNSEWKLYNLDNKKDIPLFKAFQDIHSENQGWSPDGKYILFGCLAYEESAAKKAGYKGLTRIIAVELNSDKSAVVSKKKYDRNFHYLHSEGDMIEAKNLKFSNNTTIAYNEKGTDTEDYSKTGTAKTIDITQPTEETK